MVLTHSPSCALPHTAGALLGIVAASILIPVLEIWNIYGVSVRRHLERRGEKEKDREGNEGTHLLTPGPCEGEATGQTGGR